MLIIDGVEGQRAGNEAVLAAGRSGARENGPGPFRGLQGSDDGANPFVAAFLHVDLVAADDAHAVSEAAGREQGADVERATMGRESVIGGHEDVHLRAESAL